MEEEAAAGAGARSTPGQSRALDSGQSRTGSARERGARRPGARIPDVPSPRALSPDARRPGVPRPVALRAISPSRCPPPGAAAAGLGVPGRSGAGPVGRTRTRLPSPGGRVAPSPVTPPLGDPPRARSPLRLDAPRGAQRYGAGAAPGGGRGASPAPCGTRSDTVRRPQVCHRPPPAAPGPAGPEAAAPPVVPGQARSAPSRTARALTASPGPGPRRPRRPHGPRRPAASQRPGSAPPCGHRLPGPALPGHAAPGCAGPRAAPPRARSSPAAPRPGPAAPLRPAPAYRQLGGPRGFPLLHDPEGRAGPGPPGPRRGGCTGTGGTGWSRGGGRDAAAVSPVPVRWHRAPAWSSPGGGQGPGASWDRAPRGCGVGSERGGAAVTAARDPAWAPAGLADVTVPRPWRSARTPVGSAADLRGVCAAFTRLLPPFGSSDGKVSS